MQVRLIAQLSTFMFLQYFIWGSWYVSMGAYLANALHFGGQEIGAAYGAFAIGSMISPFFIGLVALGNSLSLHHLRDAKRDFPRVKILSAVGWIAGGVAVSALGADQTSGQFYLAGGISVVFGCFAFTLPHTPPRKVGGGVSVGEILGLDALALLKKRSFAVFIGCMFLICVPLYFYFVNMSVYLGELGWPNATARMTLAQVSDVVFLFLLAVMLKRLGYKTTISLGILAWTARYFLLAGSVDATAAQTTLIFAAICLHGVCYDFLFIAGQLYVDGESNERMRGAAQGFIAFILWGVGAFVGTLCAGKVMAGHKLAEPVGKIEHEWTGIWIQPAIGAGVVLVVFLLFFREPRTTGADPPLPAGPRDISAAAPGS